jgi:NTP pyrophosphatase (non-canonical NTP hydrolase)
MSESVKSDPIKRRSISSWQKEVYRNNVAKGWWEDGKRNPYELLALIHSEVSEAVESLRNDEPMLHYGKVNPKTTASPTVQNSKGESFLVGPMGSIDGKPHLKPEGFASEAADAVIRIMDMCQGLGVDLEHAINLKHEYNKTRPYRHGGKKA